MLESNGYKVERKFNLGGTLVCFESLKNDQIDVYPEYTGTISEAILKLNNKPGWTELNEVLNKDHQLDYQAVLDSITLMHLQSQKVQQINIT